MKLFSCSTQLSIKFQLLIKGKMMKNNDLSCFKLSDIVFILLINVKMTTIVGILTFMSRMIFVLSWVEYQKSFITSATVLHFVQQCETIWEILVVGTFCV